MKAVFISAIALIVITESCTSPKSESPKIDVVKCAEYLERINLEYPSDIFTGNKVVMLINSQCGPCVQKARYIMASINNYNTRYIMSLDRKRSSIPTILNFTEEDKKVLIMDAKNGLAKSNLSQQELTILYVKEGKILDADILTKEDYDRVKVKILNFSFEEF